MALTTTTLVGGITASQQDCIVASATGIVAGDYMLIDQEFVRVGKSYVSGTTIPLSGRGVNGTVASAHATSANVTHGTGADFANAAPQASVSYPIAGKAKTLTSYSASGAIALPTPGSDAIAVLNGTSVLAMTIADPTKDMDGCELTVIGNGTAAHTLTFASGLSGEGGSYDVITFNASGPVAMKFIACNGFWYAFASVAITGTVTNITAALA